MTAHIVLGIILLAVGGFLGLRCLLDSKPWRREKAWRSVKHRTKTRLRYEAWLSRMGEVRHDGPRGPWL